MSEVNELPTVPQSACIFVSLLRPLSKGRAYTAFGMAKSLTAWAKLFNVPYGILSSRYKKIAVKGDNPPVLEAVLRGVVMSAIHQSDAGVQYQHDGKCLTLREWENELGLSTGSLDGPYWSRGRIQCDALPGTSDYWRCVRDYLGRSPRMTAMTITWAECQALPPGTLVRVTDSLRYAGREVPREDAPYRAYITLDITPLTRDQFESLPPRFDVLLNTFNGMSRARKEEVPLPTDGFVENYFYLDTYRLHGLEPAVAAPHIEPTTSTTTTTEEMP